MEQPENLYIYNKFAHYQLLHCARLKISLRYSFLLPSKIEKHDMADLVAILGSDRFPRIFNALTAQLPIRDIVALTRTCRALNPLYRKMMNKNAWDINARLQKFVKDPVAFRQRLAELDGIISGGFALQFMDRVNWKGSDLDVCVQVGDKANEFCRYMGEVEGYDLASRKAGSYQWTHVAMVRRESARLELH